MPQLNILTVGFTVQVFLALAVVWLGLNFCEGILLDVISDGLDAVRGAFQLPPGRVRFSY